jgi:hypothetical protein
MALPDLSASRRRSIPMAARLPPLAGRQWTIDEMRAGLAWHALHA